MEPEEEMNSVELLVDFGPAQKSSKGTSLGNGVALNGSDAYLSVNDDKPSFIVCVSKEQMLSHCLATLIGMSTSCHSALITPCRNVKILQGSNALQCFHVLK